MLGRIAEATRRNLGETHPAVVINYYNWAAKLQDMGDDKAAEPVYRAGPRPAPARRRRRQAVRRRDPERPGPGRGGAGRTRPSAIPSWRPGSPCAAACSATMHGEVAYSLHALGNVHSQRGDEAGADVYLRECVAIRDSVLAPDDWQRAATRSDLARCLVDLGKNAEAVPLLEEAIKGLDAHEFTADLAAEARKMLARARRG